MNMNREARRKTKGQIKTGGTIEILLGDPDGRPFTRPYYASMDRGSTVSWAFDGPWVVNFRKRTPLVDEEGKKVFVIRNGDAPVKIARDADGHYPYDLIALESAKGISPAQIRFDLACPEIIIEFSEI